jgi:hypothetical protein
MTGMERAANAYNRLFEVRLLHHYWLDEGATVFDNIADQAGKDARLLTYDARAFFAIAPTPSTDRQLQALGCIFKPTALGFIVGAPAAATIPTSTVLTVVVSTVDSQVFDYTALTLRPQTIYELFDPTNNAPDRATYRYKENVPVLSNLTGTTRGAGANAVLFLSSEIPAPSTSDQVEALVLSGGALLQLTGDNPGAATQQLGATAANLPAYVHQADAPPIVPPAGIAGAPARGVALSSEVSDDVFVLVSLTAVRADNDAFSYVDGTGAAKPNPPVYQLRFRNRSTIWTYRDKQTGAVKATEPNLLPLTYFGNAGAKQKPSRGVVKATQSGSKVTALISEIYV